MSGTGVVAGLVGPPGIGKSRLARESAESARGHGLEVFSTYCEPHTREITAGNLVLALKQAGRDDEAMIAASGLVNAAEATRNPFALSLALFCEGYVFSEAEPDRALRALRRGLTIAQQSSSRYNITILAAALSRLESEYGDPLAAFEYSTLAIRTYHDSGNALFLRAALAILATHFNRLTRYEPAATIAGFATSPLTIAGLPELSTAIAHLREVLGETTYESLARKGETMTAAAMATYAYNEIDQARAELNAAAK